jgi:hypothetical protein
MNKARELVALGALQVVKKIILQEHAALIWKNYR